MLAPFPNILTSFQHVEVLYLWVSLSVALTSCFYPQVSATQIYVMNLGPRAPAMIHDVQEKNGNYAISKLRSSGLTLIMLIINQDNIQ